MTCIGKTVRSLVLSEGPLVPFLVLAIVLLAGLSLWLLLSTRPPGNDSAEAGFARDMIVHHAQAVEMAEIIRDQTKSDDIHTLAVDIDLTQQAQIGQMSGWLDVWAIPATGSQPAMSWMGEPTTRQMPGMATPEQIQELREASGEEANKLFLQLMIPHHQAALQMTEAIRERTDRPEVEKLADAISTSQTAEIKNMQEMLQEKGGSMPAEPSMNMGDMQ